VRSKYLGQFVRTYFGIKKDFLWGFLKVDIGDWDLKNLGEKFFGFVKDFFENPD